MRTTPYTGPSCRCPAFDRMHEFPCCLNRPKVAAPPPEPAPVSPMVERVARALYEREKSRALRTSQVLSAATGKPRHDFEPFEEHREAWIGDARAAIEEMRRATGPMLQVGADAHGATDSRSAGAYAISVQDAADCWEAMIDAALSEDPTT